MWENRSCELYESVIDRVEIIKLKGDSDHVVVDNKIVELVDERENKLVEDSVSICVLKFKLNMNRMTYCAECCSVHCQTGYIRHHGENVSQRIHSLLNQVKRFRFNVGSDCRRAVSRLSITKSRLTSNISAQRVALLKWLDEKEQDHMASVNPTSASFTRVEKYLSENENELTRLLDMYTSSKSVSNNEEASPSETFTLKSKIYSWNDQLNEKQRDLDTYLFRNVRRVRFVHNHESRCSSSPAGFLCFNTFY